MALTDVQIVIINTLKSSKLRQCFYWTGGTLLAEKYFHHRLSYDIDLFSDSPFQYEEVLPFVKEVQKKTGLKFIEEKKIFDRWEFFLHNHQETRLEFVYYNFPFIKKRAIWRGVIIDSLDDLAANKAMAMLDRHEPKDAVDLYFFLTKPRFTLKRLLQLVYKKFGVQIDISTFLGEILLGSERLSTVKPLLFGTFHEQEKKIKEIKKYFANLSADYLRRQF